MEESSRASRAAADSARSSHPSALLRWACSSSRQDLHLRPDASEAPRLLLTYYSSSQLMESNHRDRGYGPRRFPEQTASRTPARDRTASLLLWRQGRVHLARRKWGLYPAAISRRAVLAPSAGIAPATSRSVAVRSNLLSYEGKVRTDGVSPPLPALCRATISQGLLVSRAGIEPALPG
jgi:hypothetical protein